MGERRRGQLPETCGQYEEPVVCECGNTEFRMVIDSEWLHIRCTKCTVEALVTKRIATKAAASHG